MATFTPVSEEERLEIGRKLVAALTSDASETEIKRLQTMLPTPPWLAKSLKETIGVDGLLESDLNLYDAVREYGEEFLKE